MVLFFFSSRRRHTRFDCDWSSDVCSSDLDAPALPRGGEFVVGGCGHEKGSPGESCCLQTSCRHSVRRGGLFAKIGRAAGGGRGEISGGGGSFKKKKKKRGGGC